MGTKNDGRTPVVKAAQELLAKLSYRYKNTAHDRLGYNDLELTPLREALGAEESSRVPGVITLALSQSTLNAVLIVLKHVERESNHAPTAELASEARLRLIDGLRVVALAGRTMSSREAGEEIERLLRCES